MALEVACKPIHDAPMFGLTASWPSIRRLRGLGPSVGRQTTAQGGYWRSPVDHVSAGQRPISGSEAQ